MTVRSMKNGIEVLDDLVDFFQSSAALLTFTCSKLRKTHGPTFKLATVKALLNLRTDLTKDEKTEAIKLCKEVLDSYRNENFEQGAAKGKQIFQNIDTTQAEEEEDEAAEGDADDMALEDFIKEGGINLDDIEDASGDKDGQQKGEGEEGDQATNTDPDPAMKGYLTKTSLTVSEDDGDDVLGKMITAVGSGMKFGIKLFAETIQMQPDRKFFAIKNGVLYWY